MHPCPLYPSALLPPSSISLSLSLSLSVPPVADCDLQCNGRHHSLLIPVHHFAIDHFQNGGLMRLVSVA